jgi:hypothetical protein
VSEADVAAQDVTPMMAAVAAAVGAPTFIVPWLDRFYDEADARLVLAAPAFDGVDPEGFARAVRRAILDADDAGDHAPADFHERLEIWAMFEGWKDVPPAVHRELADWDVDFYAEKIRADVETVRDGHPSDSYEARYTYVLLEEAEAIVTAQEHTYLWPCDCRSLVGECRKPRDVCLRFENERGLGWEISRERAIEILRSTDKAGLMHTSDLRDNPGKASSICNCCTDCCYPHLASARLGAEDVWPVRRPLPLRCHHGGLGRPPDARAGGLQGLRPVLHDVPHGGHRHAASRRAGLTHAARDLTDRPGPAAQSSVACLRIAARASSTPR